MRGRNEGASSVLYHVHDQDMGEGLGGIVHLLEHVVDLPLINQADCFGVDLHKYQRHGTSCVEVAALTSASLKPTYGPLVWMIDLITAVILSPHIMCFFPL